MIAIISSTGDAHAQSVIEQLRTQGRRDVFVLELSKFPMQMDVTMRLGGNGHRQFSLGYSDGRKIPLEEISAFWWRRPEGFGIPAEVKNPVYRHFAMSEAATAFQGMWQSSDALWVNDIVLDAAAAHKPYQLATAKDVGLSIPETLITNNPEEASRFWKENQGQTVYKAFSASAYAWRETRILKPDEERQAANVRISPVIFQRYVPAAADLRVTAIGSDMFSASADARGSDYQVDVRFNTKVKYEKHALPVDIQEKLLKLMRILGLEYGAIDLRLTPDGEYIFLEVNPAGQFLYIEHGAGHPISDALASFLAKGKRTSRTTRGATS